MITIKEALEYVHKHYYKELPRLRDLEKCYLGKNDILLRKERPNGAITNRIPHNFSSYIANQTSNYFMGTPIDYVCPQEDSYFELDRILRANSSSTLDADLSLDMAIFGVAFEIAYINTSGELELAKLNTKRVIPIYNMDIKPRLTDAIVYDVIEAGPNKSLIRLSIYDESEVSTYEGEIIGDFDSLLIDNTLSLTDTRYHFIGQCPIIEYKNNRYNKGDFEDVIPLINSYDILESLSLDDCEDFTNAYLMLSKIGDLDDDMKKAIRDSKIIDFTEDGKAEWLIKNINDVFIENLKNRVNRDIHKITGTLDLSDNSLYAGVTSGVALKWRYSGLELKRKEKERQYTISLLRRLDIIKNFLAKQNVSIDPNEIEIMFSVSMPSNEAEIADIVTKLKGIISDKSLLSMLPWISDIEAEIERIEEEQATTTDYIGAFENETLE